MTNKLVDFLDSCESEGVRYVSWKGYHKIELALSGRADLDIFIEPENCDTFKQLAIKFGLLKLVPPVGFAGISHWYLPDSQSYRWFHLHVYYQPRTGASFSKSFVIEHEGWLEKRVLSKSGIYILPIELACQIHMTRLMLRRLNLISKIFYLREKFKHDLEADMLGVPRGAERIELLEFGRCKNQSAIKSTHNILTRVKAKLLNRRKRLEQGRIVSIVGSDGSGKSTLVRLLKAYFSKEVDVFRTSFGRPEFSITTSLFWVLRNLAQGLTRKTKWFYPNKSFESPKTTSISVAVYHLCLAIERLLIIRKSRRLASNGWLVLMDRCPTQTPGQMDGPKISGNTGFIGSLSHLEHQIYEAMGKVDLALKLSISNDEAVRRNNSRKKFGKETEDEILFRFELFKSYIPSANNTLVIDANVNLDKLVKKSVASILDILNANKFSKSDG